MLRNVFAFNLSVNSEMFYYQNKMFLLYNGLFFIGEDYRRFFIYVSIL